MKNKRKMFRMLAIVLIFGFTMVNCTAFTDGQKIINYLSLAKKVGRSAEGPFPLAIKVSLNNNWESLLTIINRLGVLVDLDLSQCTMTDTNFNPGSNGSEFITSLILPDTVTNITGDFNVFPNLSTIQFPASTDIDEINPFVGCSQLTFNLKGRGNLSTIENGRALVRDGIELISYPSAKENIILSEITSISRSAFNRTSLESIELPSAITIGIRAFNGCENLQIVNLPAVTAIGEAAFYGNISLKTLNIPSTITIGNNALANSGRMDLTITIGEVVETIGIGIFNEVGVRKNVTMLVPQSEVENFTARRDAIRGRGWNAGSFTLASQWQRTVGSGYYQRIETGSNFNTNISLTVEGY